MVQEIKNVVTWLKNWFYDKTEVYAKTETYSKEEVNTALGNKVNVAQGSGNSDKNVVTNSSGNITTEPKVSAGSGLSLSNANQMSHSNSVTAQTSAVFKKITHDGQGHITGTANVDASDLPTHGHTTSQIVDTIAHSNIGTDIYVSQNVINTAIDTAIGNLQSIKAIEVGATKPTASASTMGKLYIVSENSKVNVYYTKQSGTSPNYTYSWQKMDTDILDELSIDWSDITNKPNLEDFVLSDDEGLMGETCQLFCNVTENDPDFDRGLYALNDTLLNPANSMNLRMYRSDQTYEGKHYIPIASILDVPTDVSALTDTTNKQFTPKSHYHGQITNDGKIDSSSVTSTISDWIVIVDQSDSNKIKKASYVYTAKIKEDSAYTNIGSAADATQHTINGLIDTALSNKVNAGDAITSIALVPKGSDPTADAYNGVIRLYYGDEPS